MTVVHVVAGLVSLVLGAFMITRRESLPIRKASAGRTTSAPPTLWLYLGVMFVALGLLQLLLALV